MRCLKCNAKWDSGNIRPPVLLCPVCEVDYTGDPSLKEYSSIAEFLYELRANKSDVFYDSKRALAYLNDYFPREAEVRDELKELYERGLLDTIVDFSDGKISDEDFSEFVNANTTESLRAEILELLQFVLGVNPVSGTDFGSSDYYKDILEKLNDDSYRIKALEKAIAVDGDSSLKEQLIDFKIKTGDMKDAVKDLEKAAATGDAQALYALAVMYKEGSYYQKDLDKAQGLLKMASEKGHSAADYLLADLLFEIGEKKADAIGYLKKAADKDNVKAQCRLYSELYAQNAKEAIGYLKKAAFLSYAPAMYEYSLHLLYGDDVDQDVDSAIKFLEEAALKDEKDAISKLAYIYSVGFMVNKDMNKAQIYKEKLRED